MLPCLSLLCFMVYGPPALLLDPSPNTIARAPATSIQAFGRGHACAAWSNGCVICTRTGTGAQCSTPGIACAPSPVACTQP